MKWNLSIFFLLVWFYNTSFASISFSSSEKLWGSAEYLYWWPQDSPVGVPLVTKNNNPSALGIINQPGTQIIFGSGANNNNFNLSSINGARITIGGWFDRSDQFGLEASSFGFSKIKKTFNASSVSGKIPAINIPFFDILNSTENVLVARHPNTATVSDSFQPWTLTLNGMYNLSNQFSFPFVLLTGFRYVGIKENFTLNDAVFELPTFPNSVVNIRDNFSTKNNFYGFQVGGRTHFVYDNFLFDVTATMALGENFQKLNINGQINENNNRILQSFGLFTEPSNIGTFHQHQFTMVSEILAKLGYEFNKNIIPFITYNFFYINKIIRPGEQIDRNINKSQNPALGGTGTLRGPAVPSPHFNNTGMWMQGLSAGVEISF